ncbi:MAG: response regulator [Deltaproteobacteria bacterium]|nr:MAG: response regulator [Deltaproteobacteria bacterium]
MGFSVLIVDDSLSMRKLIKKVIELSGFDVEEFLEAANGREALQLLEDHWVDLVLCDIHMPEMDGLELLRRMRQEEVLGRIPVIMISTEGREEVLKEAQELGAKGYVKKPFSPEKIRETMDRVMGEEYARGADR